MRSANSSCTRGRLTATMDPFCAKRFPTDPLGSLYCRPPTPTHGAETPPCAHPHRPAPPPAQRVRNRLLMRIRNSDFRGYSVRAGVVWCSGRRKNHPWEPGGTVEVRAGTGHASLDARLTAGQSDSTLPLCATHFPMRRSRLLRWPLVRLLVWLLVRCACVACGASRACARVADACVARLCALGAVLCAGVADVSSRARAGA